MYYKIEIGGQITLADHLDFIRELPNGVIVRCRQENANGITLGGVNYHADGLPAFPTAAYDTVTVEEITRAEYLELADELNIKVNPNLEDIDILQDKIIRQQAQIDYISMMTDVDLEDELNE